MKKLSPKTPGRLITNNVILETHEYKTINTLLKYGNDVELIIKSRTPHSKSADIFMLGRAWEIKSPTGKTMRSIDRIIHRATHQSQNIIIDLRRSKLNEKQIIVLLETLFCRLQSIRNLWIITKRGDILKFKK